MIPMFAHLRITSPRRRFSLVGIPLILIWLLLLPVMLLILPILFIACWIAHIDPFRLTNACWNVFASLKGMHVEYAAGDQSVLVHLT